jgi:hypothetical protein
LLVRYGENLEDVRSKQSSEEGWLCPHCVEEKHPDKVSIKLLLEQNEYSFGPQVAAFRNLYVSQSDRLLAYNLHILKLVYPVNAVSQRTPCANPMKGIAEHLSAAGLDLQLFDMHEIARTQADWDRHF